MGTSKNLRRSEPLFIRLTDKEKAALRKRAKSAGMYMVEYARCKIFDIPLEYFNGRVSKSILESHKQEPEATKATA